MRVNTLRWLVVCLVGWLEFPVLVRLEWIDSMEWPNDGCDGMKSVSSNGWDSAQLDEYVSKYLSCLKFASHFDLLFQFIYIYIYASD
jgi:hypothetical protein